MDKINEGEKEKLKEEKLEARKKILDTERSANIKAQSKEFNKYSDENSGLHDLPLQIH